MLLLDSTPTGATPVPLTLIEAESEPLLPALSATLTTDEANPVSVGVNVSVKSKLEEDELLIVTFDDAGDVPATDSPKTDDESEAENVELHPFLPV